ncbi:MAG: hypothetical protein NZM27_10655 [Acetobacteraceae bacterium]|nr:hypothetical protein [Acetobacteraceae bacterium]
MLPARDFAAAVAATALLLLWPAVHNGHPLIFSDSMDFLALAREPLAGAAIRPRGYPLFILPFIGAAGTAWAAVAAQAAVTAWLALRVAVLLAPGIGAGALFALGGLLAASSAPWAASYVMADSLTAPLVLSLLVLLHPAAGRAEKAVALVVALLAAAAHTTHLAMLLAVSALLLGWRIADRAAPAGWARAALPALLAAAGFVLSSLGTLAAEGRFEYARAAPQFLAARLAGDGLLQRHLERICPAPGVTLCADLPTLPDSADGFLWDPASPLWQRGDFFALEAELRALNRAVLAAYWPEWLARSALRAAEQLLTLRAGDGLDRELVVQFQPAYARIMGEAEGAALAASRQFREELGEHPAAVLAGALNAGAMAGCAVLLLAFGALWRRERPALLLALFVVFAAAAANAAAIGLGGSVHARYQARLAWLFVLLLPIAAAARPRLSAAS